MEESKVCKDCGRERPLKEYHYSNKPKGQKKSYCKDCCYERNKIQIAKDPVAWRYYQQRYYEENPEKYPGNYVTKTIPMVCGVYKIDCVLTDDSYVGCSKNIRGRMYKHRKASGRGKQQNLYKLIKLYGWEAFNVTVLEECDKEVLFERETYWINKLQPNLNKNKK
jgi:predicted GIY-YIG superfamily endonuclease